MADDWNDKTRRFNPEVIRYTACVKSSRKCRQMLPRCLHVAVLVLVLAGFILYATSSIDDVRFFVTWLVGPCLTSACR